ncbi:putative N6-adenine-specific DNA methylase [Salsuginibacillus halophilus]|uniref:Putative N6-adenine-specific DNA methylase n=1 Tax=Salsuginibacillus halophilus TaxID=517424 RepID=A0A2P8HYR2_9BACI|nr:class I SAM-dependent RNA methyltransferase [Salsuginibacillus halophilus]PSL51359.1 putative N6-adenine-specific DNA methylase [Salsuginibacillus halophilus]
MQTYSIVISTQMGLEGLVGKEVRALGYHDAVVENGQVRLEATIDAIPRLNLWLRTGDRVKIVIDEFRAVTFDELFEGTKALPWENYLPANAEFPVVGRTAKSQLYSVPDCQSIVKKAVVDRMASTYQTSWFQEDGPMFRIEVAIHKDDVTLTLDTSGNSLHKRGYRERHSEAPLKETLAAALIQLTNWHPDRPFVDPFTGSGTLPIEAALIGQNIAPGSFRSFASEAWDWIDNQLYNQAREEAEDAADYDRKLSILGTDIDHQMVELATYNAEEIGLQDVVSFKQMQASDFQPKSEGGVIVGNPPYGERLSETKAVETLYRELGACYRELETWSVYILTSHPRFEDLYGKEATKRRKLYNGRMETHYYQFWGKKPSKIKE